MVGAVVALVAVACAAAACTRSSGTGRFGSGTDLLALPALHPAGASYSRPATDIAGSSIAEAIAWGQTRGLTEVWVMDPVDHVLPISDFPGQGERTVVSGTTWDRVLLLKVATTRTADPWVLDGHVEGVKARGSERCFACHEETWCSSCHSERAQDMLTGSATSTSDGPLSPLVRLSPAIRAVKWRGEGEYTLEVEAASQADVNARAVELIPAALGAQAMDKLSLWFYRPGEDEPHFEIAVSRERADATDWARIEPGSVGNAVDVYRAVP